MRITILFLFLLVFGAAFAQGDPCLNPDSNEAVIYYESTLEPDTIYVCSDTVNLSCNNVGAVNWSTISHNSTLSNAAGIEIQVLLDSTAKTKREAIIRLEVTNECGSFTDEVLVKYNMPTLVFGKDTSIYFPTDVDLGTEVDRKGITAINYFDKSDFLADPNSLRTVAEEVTRSVNYVGTIEVDESEGGCIVRDTIRIKYVDSVWGPILPQAFTPNGDGFNDVLFVRMGGEEKVTLIVYDRWEREIFKTTGKVEELNGWDGTYNGKEMGAGVYVYVVYGYYKDKSTFMQKGKVSVLR
jgi:gliding motility-associated-like protein